MIEYKSVETFWKKVKGGNTMRRNARFHAIALAAALGLQTLSAPLAYAAEDSFELEVEADGEEELYHLKVMSAVLPKSHS